MFHCLDHVRRFWTGLVRHDKHDMQKVYSHLIGIYERVKAAKLSPKEYAKGLFNIAVAIHRENSLFSFQRNPSSFVSLYSIRVLLATSSFSSFMSSTTHLSKAPLPSVYPLGLISSFSR